MGTILPQLRYASLSDPGRRRLANEDACHCDDRMSLFVVCDGLGGLPSGEAASQIVAHSFGHLLRRALRQAKSLDQQTLSDLLGRITVQLSQHLRHESSQIPALQGMGATLVAALVDRGTCFILHAGDSRAYLLHEGELCCLTRDHCRTSTRYRDPGESSPAAREAYEKRVLINLVGHERPAGPEVKCINLAPGDRLLLCTDGLTDPVDDEGIKQIVGHGAAPAAACQELVNRANELGGPDNITATIIDYLGTREVSSSELRDLARRPTGKPVRGLAQALHDHLRPVETQLAWLNDAANECASLPTISAFAAVKRHLGPEVYTRFLELHPSQNPMHVFHRACTIPDTGWRKQYDATIKALEPVMSQATGGSARMSPILNSEETSLILRTLWRDWRRVERRYFSATQREAISESEQTLKVLVEHMLASVRTILGLLAFFPRFMREP